MKYLLLAVILSTQFVYADWVLTSESKKYSKALYWTGVGIAARQSQARELAASEISKQFQLHISTRNRDTQVSMNSNVQADTHEEFYFSKTVTQSALTLEGVEFVESKEVEGGVAVLAVLNKNDFQSRHQARVDSLAELIAQNIQVGINSTSLMEVWSQRVSIEKALSQITQSRNLLNKVSMTLNSHDLELPLKQFKAHHRSIMAESVKFLNGDQYSKQFQYPPIQKQCLGSSNQIIGTAEDCLWGNYEQLSWKVSPTSISMSEWVNESSVKRPLENQGYSYSKVDLNSESLNAKDLVQALKSTGILHSQKGPRLKVNIEVNQKSIRGFAGYIHYFQFKGNIILTNGAKVQKLEVNQQIQASQPQEALEKLLQGLI